MIIIFLSPFSLQAGEVSLRLDEAIAIALRDNRDILLKSQELQKAKFKLEEAKAGLYPSLSFTGSWTRTNEYYKKDISQDSIQLSLKQYLYKGGEIINTIKYDGFKIEVAQALLDKTKLETVAAVKKAFYTLLLAEDLLSLNKQILKNTQDHLDSLNARFKKGEVSRSDILQLSASLSNVKRAYQESAHQREAAEALLHKLLYLGEDVTLVPEGILGYHKREVAFDAAFLKAMQNRPEIRQYNAQAKADESAIELARADNRPDIYASWDYYSKSHLATTGGLSRSRNDYNIMGITISWPLFDGWATRAKVEQALVDLKETQLTKEKAIKDITLELKNAYLSLKNAISKIEASNADLALYRDNLRSSLEKYREGILSSLDKDDARLKYTVAKFNKEQAIYDYLIAKNSFEQATGGYS